MKTKLTGLDTILNVKLKMNVDGDINIIYEIGDKKIKVGFISCDGGTIWKYSLFKEEIDYLNKFGIATKGLSIGNGAILIEEP